MTFTEIQAKDLETGDVVQETGERLVAIADIERCNGWVQIRYEFCSGFVSFKPTEVFKVSRSPVVPT